VAVILKNAIFLHIPKCGGEWVRRVLWNSGMEDVKLHPGRQKHSDLAWFENHLEFKRPFRFSFVRHPVSWYRSFYGYQKGRLWIPIPEIGLRPPQGLSYLAFMDWVLNYHSGFLGRLYERYVGTDENPIEFIGKTRSLRTDLADALLRSGNRVPWRLIDTFPQINISRVCPVSTKQLDDAIVEAERDLCVRFGFL